MQCSQSQCCPSSSSLIMREQSLPRFKFQTGLLPGMLKRTKYSRLRNDSLTSLEDRTLSLKGELRLDSDFAQMDPGTSSHHGLSTLRDFIPRVANIRLQSPISLWGFGGQGGAAGDRTIDGPTDKPLSRTECGPGPNQRLCSQSSFNSPQPAGCCTGRPVTLHWMASLPWTSSAAHNCMELGAVHHDIKYMGSVEVIQSMRTLDFDTRIQVTREAISRLCEKTSDKTKVKTKRSVCKGRSAILGQINLRFSGSRIVLSVSTDSLTLITASSLQKIAHHPMQAISFASRGDPDMADYIAYVAKDLTNHRACHILECPQGRACEVISSIGQAFETSFHQLLSHWPSLLSSNPRSAVRICPNWRQQETIAEQKAKQEAENSAHCNYYNVIPGKTPPPGGTEDLRITRETKLDAHTQDPWSRPVSLFKNCSITEETPAPPADSGGSEVSPEQCTPLSESPDRDLIQEEGWFHGRLGRKQAESLLTCSGDFLVRESSSACGQYVLSGMEGGNVQHLLLVDPHGQVRTRDQVFVSVGHLVRFHMENQIPIISGSSELHLKQPILQRH